MLVFYISAITACTLTLQATGNSLPQRINSRSTFTTKLTDEGHTMLANNFQFLCSLKPSTSGSGRAHGGGGGMDWMAVMQDSILQKIIKPGESREDINMKRVLTETILTNVVANCEDDFEYQDQPSDKGVRQVGETNHVENILQNIFSGNIMGIIRSYSPTAKVSTAVSDVFRTLFTNISSVRSRIGGYSFMGSSKNSTSGTTTAKSMEW